MSLRRLFLVSCLAVAALSSGCSTTSTSTSTSTSPTSPPPPETAPVVYDGARGVGEHQCVLEAEAFDCSGCAIVSNDDPSTVAMPQCARDAGACPIGCCGLCPKE